MKTDRELLRDALSLIECVISGDETCDIIDEVRARLAEPDDVERLSDEEIEAALQGHPYIQHLAVDRILLDIARCVESAVLEKNR